MSRVGKHPIPIPEKAKVNIEGTSVSVTGPKGSLSWQVPQDISVAVADNAVVVTRSSDLAKYRALHGLTRALIHNMVVGVTDGFKKELEIIGVGYRAEMRGKHLLMYLGFSHPVLVTPPEGIRISVVPKENRVTVEGADKQLVGEVAARIRGFRKPEPYKGKGIRYVGEHVRQKAGKTAGA